MQTAAQYITQFAECKSTPDRWKLAYYDDEQAGESAETRKIREQTQALNRAIFQAQIGRGYRA